MQCQIIRPLLRAPCWCGSQLAVSRSFSYTLKTLEPTESKPTPRIFLSSPIGETNDAERRYIQAKTTTITPSEQSGKSDDFTVEHLEAKLKKVDLCKKYGLQPRDVRMLRILPMIAVNVCTRWSCGIEEVLRDPPRPSFSVRGSFRTLVLGPEEAATFRRCCHVSRQRRLLGFSRDRTY